MNMCSEMKAQIVYWSNWLNLKHFVTARSGNVSCRTDDGKVLITAHDAYLGRLEDDEIVMVDVFGNGCSDGKEASSEKSLHCGIYERFCDINVVIHTHSPYTTAFFHYFSKLDVFSFEAQFSLGDVPIVPQETPTVTDVGPVLKAFADNNIVVLKNHGVVAGGKTFKDAVGLIELLEEQAKINLTVQNFRDQSIIRRDSNVKQEESSVNGAGQSVKLLSKEHGKRLQQLINEDDEAQALGRKHNMTCVLAVKNEETNQVMRFVYEQGEIVTVDDCDVSEFMIIGSRENLRKVFNREMNPFVAITQGKVKAKGNFIKMSKWFPVMKRTFKLWEQVAVV